MSANTIVKSFHRGHVRELQRARPRQPYTSPEPSYPQRLFCLEGECDSNLEKLDSVEPLLDFLERLHICEDHST